MAERWERVQELLEEALALPEAERRAFLETACGADASLLDEVRELLEAVPLDEEMPTAWLRSVAEEPGPRFEKGQRVGGRYLVSARLGSGGMGEVYEAYDEELGIPVALKTLQGAGDEGEALERLRLESMLARAVWHPNVCRVYDLGRHEHEWGPSWFLTMERLHGVTLAERLRETGPLSPERALPLACEMAAGLGAAHRAGVVHCDFKPGNIMLVPMDGREQVMVTDFGTSTLSAWGSAAVRGRSDLALVGTPAYMAPEQARGERAGPAADIFALGVVLFEMMTGSLPFHGETALELLKSRLEREAPRARSVRPDLDPRWDTVIARCLARETWLRFPRAEEVADALTGRAPAVEAAPFGRAPAPPRALPAETDPFVGREEELATLARIFAGGARVVTLLGAGGMGKTRLALHYASLDPGAWPGGVWFCDLAHARDAAGVGAAVAGALGLPAGGGDPIEQLGHALAQRGRSLLVLDELEGVTAPAGEALGRWLNLAGGACFLVTSREPLRIPGEHLLAVDSLPADVGARLFELRARGLRPRFELSGAGPEEVREIVRMLDGMPLAIELAAARTRVMDVPDIATRMRQRLSLLAGGRDARHETLAGAIDGSWELLAPWERSAWAQCAVFEGGFTADAAAAVVDLAAFPGPPPILDVLRSLVDKCMLRMWAPALRPGEITAEPRLGMYAPLHDYARKKLVELGAGDGRAARERHARWYARFGTDEAIEALDHHGGGERRQRLARELENLTAACRTALEAGADEVAASAYRALTEAHLMSGPYAPALALGLELLAGLPPGPRTRTGVLRALATIERLSGRADDAHRHWEEAIALARSNGERRIEGLIMGGLGTLHGQQGRMAEARSHFETAVAIACECGDRRAEGMFTSYLGTVDLGQGRLEQARARLESSLDVHREVGNRRFEAFVLAYLARTHRELGQLEEAALRSQQALARYRENGDRNSEALALGLLGELEMARGRLEEALTHYAGAISISREMGQRRVEGIFLSGAAEVERCLERHDAARSRFQSALTRLREVGDGRNEAIAEVGLARVLLSLDDLAAAREAAERAERILRGTEAPSELGRTLCIRARIEARAGHFPAARVRLAEAESIAASIGAGPGSDLEKLLAETRSSLASQE